MEKKSILLVDNDPTSSGELFTALVRAGHSVTDTSKPEFAAEILRDRSFNVAIVDVLTSKAKDFDLIELLRSGWANPLIIALADFEAIAVRKAVISRGANHFIKKPVDMDHLLGLISPARDFSGRVEGVDILEFLQFMLLTGKRTIVEIKSQTGRSCTLYLDGGAIVHAQFENLEGEKAVYKGLSLQGGQFTNLPWIAPPKRTISKPGQFLLMEAARIRDEL